MGVVTVLAGVVTDSEGVATDLEGVATDYDSLSVLCRCGISGYDYNSIY